MIIKINGETPFQSLGDSIAIGASESGYTLYFSTDGVNYTSTGKSVTANTELQYKANTEGLYYKLVGNTGEVSVSMVKDCHSGGTGGGIEEAPEDGKTYGRKDADWTEVTGGEVDTDEIEDVISTAFADLNTKVDDNNTAINAKVDLSDELSAAGIYYSVKSSDDTIKDIIKLTQAEYDAITTPDTKTLYIITD